MSSPPSLISSVPLKNSLKVFVKKNVLIQTIVNEITLISNYKDLINGPTLIEFIEHVCNIVENNINTKTPIEEKKSIIITIFKTLFPDVTITTIEQQITYFLANNIIKKIPQNVKMYNYLKSYLKKKIGF